MGCCLCWPWEAWGHIWNTLARPHEMGIGTIQPCEPSCVCYKESKRLALPTALIQFAQDLRGHLQGHYGPHKAPGKEHTFVPAKGFLRPSQVVDVTTYLGSFMFLSFISSLLSPTFPLLPSLPHVQSHRVFPAPHLQYNECCCQFR